MTNLTTYPRQDLFETTLLSDIDSSTTSVVLNNAPNFTLSSGSLYVHVDYDNSTKYEPMLITSITGATLTVTRGVAKYEGGGSTATAHSSGAKVRFSVSWKDFDNLKTAINSKVDASGGIFTTPATDATYASLAALQAAYPTPTNGMSAFCTAEGSAYDAAGGAWVARATGSTPNASTTVAGKVEIATLAEIQSGTATGGTGAPLVPSPDNLLALLIPVGAILPYGGSSAPSGYLICDGSAISRTTYATLFSVLSTSYGIGDGSTTFNLPDFRGKAAYGKSAAGTYNALGNTGGAETATLAAHTHDLDTNGGAKIYIDNNGSTDISYSDRSGPSLGSQTIRTGTAISNSSRSATYNSPSLTGRTASITSGASTQSIVNPYLVCNYIIKT